VPTHNTTVTNKQISNEYYSYTMPGHTVYQQQYESWWLETCSKCL